MSTTGSSLPLQLRELVSLYLVRQRRFIHDQGLPAHGRLLMLLHKHGPMTQSEFGRIAGLDKSWVSRIVDRFVAEALVERVPLDTDRRCLQLHLTDTGETLARQVGKQLNAHAATLLSSLPEAERPALGAALATLIATLREV